MWFKVNPKHQDLSWEEKCVLSMLTMLIAFKCTLSSTSWSRNSLLQHESIKLWVNMSVWGINKYNNFTYKITSHTIVCWRTAQFGKVIFYLESFATAIIQLQNLTMSLLGKNISLGLTRVDYATLKAVTKFNVEIDFFCFFTENKMRQEWLNNWFSIRGIWKSSSAKSASGGAPILMDNVWWRNSMRTIQGTHRKLC